MLGEGNALRTGDVRTPVGDARARLDFDDLVEASGAWANDAALMDACRYVLEVPGKQLRSTMLFEAAELGPREPGEDVRLAAASVELFHAATLAHDDVVDHAALRRGRPSVAASFGASTAMLTGGWLLGRAAWIAARCPEPVAERFAAAADAVCEGQLLETRDLYNLERTPERYRAAVDGKTASLFRLAAELGALLGGLEEDAAARLARFGNEFGHAFQIADDILDLMAPASVSGKVRGNDLMQGVYTLPAIYAMRAEPGLSGRISNCGAGDVEEIAELIGELGVPQARGDCFEALDEALEALGPLPGTESLESLASWAILNRLEELDVVA